MDGWGHQGALQQRWDASLIVFITGSLHLMDTLSSWIIYEEMIMIKDKDDQQLVGSSFLWCVLL